jgi:hypothetical protein
MDTPGQLKGAKPDPLVRATFVSIRGRANPLWVIKFAALTRPVDVPRYIRAVEFKTTPTHEVMSPVLVKNIVPVCTPSSS